LVAHLFFFLGITRANSEPIAFVLLKLSLFPPITLPMGPFTLPAGPLDCVFLPNPVPARTPLSLAF